MVTSELTGEVSMGVLLVFLVFWRWGRYIGSDQQGDTKKRAELGDKRAPRSRQPTILCRPKDALSHLSPVPRPPHLHHRCVTPFRRPLLHVMLFSSP